MLTLSWAVWSVRVISLVFFVPSLFNVCVISLLFFVSFVVNLFVPCFVVSLFRQNNQVFFAFLLAFLGFWWFFFGHFRLLYHAMRYALCMYPLLWWKVPLRCGYLWGQAVSTRTILAPEFFRNDTKACFS